MLDLAREQSPDDAALNRWAEVTLESGFDTLGLYLEHRFAYAAAPWAAGTGALTAARVRALRRRYPRLHVMPFINLLGHAEGFLYTAEGEGMAAARFGGLQADAANPEWQALAARMLDETLDAFDDDWVHLGGDETAQLEEGPWAAPRAAAMAAEGVADGRARLWADVFRPLAERTVAAGRTPCVWGDMLLAHPAALAALPPETVIFDWSYFGAPDEALRRCGAAGHRTAASPTVHAYNAAWLHLGPSEANVRLNAAGAARQGAAAVCVTAWEPGLFGAAETWDGAVRGAGAALAEALRDPGPEPDPAVARTEVAEARMAPAMLRGYLAEGEAAEAWAARLGLALPAAGGPFGFSGIRSGLKCRLLLYGNPFLLWLRDGPALLGEPGERAREVLAEATPFADTPGRRGVIEFVTATLDFVAAADRADRAVRAGEIGAAQTALITGRQVFEHLERVAIGFAVRRGGSSADVARCVIARGHVDRVMRRVQDYADGSALGYRPSFATLSHPNFTPFDQGNWWLINRWARE